MKLVILLVVVSAMLVLGRAQTASQFYCGDFLARTMSILCWPDMPKRSGSQYAGYSWPWLPPFSSSRGKRGIVDECCYRPCTIDVLKLYCDNQ
ncbi:bombyxin C-2 [Bombyx mandarina]|uniref:Bombyxin C-2 n=1 Tax=Bombyx mandarina TaxID=7092 RepID=A0A6J2KAY6_BOMMA|nr:bombyxin C-2 [Bombyx mandarina]